MAQKPLTKADLQAALDAVAEHGSVTAAAKAVGIPYPTFQGRVREARSGRLERPEIQPAVDTIRAPLASFEGAWHQWMRAVGMAMDRHSPKHTPKTRKDTAKILVVPDLHAPFFERQMFADMLEAESDADHVVCIGDLSDAYAHSSFVKYERMSFSEEWASVTLAMQELSARFPKVTVVIGNHDGRLEKRIRERLSEDMVDAIRFMTGGELCPITALAKRYPNVEVASHVTPSGRSVDWFTSVGDAWLGHPEKYSRVPGAALRFLDDWITDNEESMGLDQYRILLMGHTHQMSWIPWKAGRLLVEVGCLCQHQGYMLSPRIGGRPQRRGYVTFEQTNGRTDLNSVRMHWLDQAEAVA